MAQIKSFRSIWLLSLTQIKSFSSIRLLSLTQLKSFSSIRLLGMSQIKSFLSGCVFYFKCDWLIWKNQTFTFKYQYVVCWKYFWQIKICICNLKSTLKYQTFISKKRRLFYKYLKPTWVIISFLLLAICNVLSSFFLICVIRIKK